MAAPSTLVRRLGVGSAVMLGLGSMLGAGVFAAFGPAAAAAGPLLLVALGIAAVVAFCNATASAQLAARYPVSGGTYVYGRERLGPAWGFAAGWSFVVGKTASCAAMALTAATYLAPAGWEKPVAVAAVLVLGVVNALGVTRTALVARVLVVAVVLVLAFVVVAGLVAGPARADAADLLAPAATPTGVLQGAGLLFFAFAGYARIATMGEEVRDPARVLPRAIVIALGITALLYLAVAVTLLRVLGPTPLAAAVAPLADVVRAAGWGAAVPVVAIGAGLGALGSLLGMQAGIGRTALAMARQGDLPRGLAQVSARFAVPGRAILVEAALAAVVVLLVDVRGAIGFSSFGVLLYYAIANVAALTQPAAERRWPRALQVLGIVGCLVLAVTLPPVQVVIGAAIVAIGLAGRAALRRIRR